VHLSQFHYLPLTPPFFSLLVGIFIVLIVLVQLGALRYAYMRIGLSRGAAVLLLVGSLVGSYFNIPIVELPPQQVVSGQEVVYYGMRYAIPVVEQWPGTVIAVNIGGAVIPTLMSLYLLVKYRLWVPGLLATLGVTLVCYMLANPVPGLGIAEPVFVPSLTAAIVALLLSRRHGAPLAYIGGSLGTDRRRSAQSRQGARARGAGGVDRRGRNIRRHFPDRHPGGADRKPLRRGRTGTGCAGPAGMNG
jgi:uncharacterized membrane protein